jgi:outer membrane biosynthesis protein TonB/HPt (histidine-containing phosphotransfer) domain-containing protein
MTGPTGLLNFFVLEATDYVDRLDLLLGGSDAAPDAEAFTRAARALRGSATMAKLTGISALAAAVERIGRGLRERMLPWTPQLRSALVAAVDDLRALVRDARGWGDAQERRAQERTASLLRFAPSAPRAASPTPIATSTGALFVVSGCTDVASALTAAASRPESAELLVDAVRRLRALRGVAALKDYPPLPEVLDAIERAARPADGRTVALGPAELALLGAGARLLRRAAEDVRAGRRPDGDAPEARAFRGALGAVELERAEASRIVPVSALFHDDEGPHVLHAASAPGTSAAERFRLEGAAAGEHVRRLVADARDGGEAPDAGAAAGAVSPTIVGKATRALAELVRSFGHAPLADAVSRATAGVDAADPIALAAADAVAALFVAQRKSPEELARRIGELAGGRAVGSLVAVGLAPIPPRGATPPLGSTVMAATPVSGTAAIAPAMPAPPAPSPAPLPEVEPEEQPEPLPVPTPEPARAPVPEPVREPEREPEPASEPRVPVGAAADVAAARSAGAPPDGMSGIGQPASGRRLHELLESSIAGISRLQDAATGGGARTRPAPDRVAAVAPARRTPADVVPVESLLYEGRAALGRALELREEIRRAGGPPSSEQLAELFDLLDLAARG